MNITLTGATGYIGSAVLDRLVARGDRVTAIVRTDSAADKVAAAGATPLVGDLTDTPWLTSVLRTSEAAVHAAAGGDARDAEINDSVIAAVTAAYAGTGRRFLLTGGVWTYGDNPDIDDDDEARPVDLTAWRVEDEAALLADERVDSVVVRPGIVYGRGGGLVPAILGAAPRTPDGALRLVGSGEQHWATVHVDDLADLYLLALDSAPARSVVVAANGDNPTVREIGESLADAVAPESAEDTRARLGAAFADALLLDQGARGARARSWGWRPSRPTLVEELRALF